MSANQQMLLAGQASDPYWAYVQFLAGCNALAGANNFNEERQGYNFVYSDVGSPLGTPAVSGLACTPAAGQRVTCSDADGWALRTLMGSGEFTLEGWFRRTGTINGDGTFLQWGSGNMFTVRAETATEVRMLWSINSSNSGDLATFTTLDTWMHYALTRDGSNNVRWFVQGNLEQTWAGTGGAFTYNSFSGGGSLLLGRTVGIPDNHAIGCHDEIRFTTKCRYTSAFTPVLAPWPRG